MLFENYIEEIEQSLEKTLRMFSDLTKKTEDISLNFIQDEDSVEANVDVTSADQANIELAVSKSREKVQEIATGVKQSLDRYKELSNIIARRKSRRSELDDRIYIKETGEKVIADEDKEIRETYAPLFAGLTEKEIQEKISQIKRMRGK